MSDQLVSVIVPVYNVEDYLKKCIDSILEQTHKNLELLLIDDGSTDGSPAICDDFASVDSRVSVIHQQNGGVSAARNQGIEAASGIYMCFIDGDDYVAQDYVERLLDAIQTHKADIAVGSLLRVQPNGDELYSERAIPAVLNSKDALRQMLISEDVTELAVWNKIYRRDIFIKNKIRFPVGKVYSEDVSVIYQLYTFSSKIVYISDVLYFYVQRSSSVTNRGFTRTGFDSIEIADVILQDVKVNFPGLTEAGYKFGLRFMFTVAAEICRSDPIDSEALQMLSKRARKNMKEILSSSCISLDKKVRAIILAAGWRAYLAGSRMMHLTNES